MSVMTLCYFLVPLVQWTVKLHRKKCLRLPVRGKPGTKRLMPDIGKGQSEAEKTVASLLF